MTTLIQELWEVSCIGNKWRKTKCGNGTSEKGNRLWST